MGQEQSVPEENPGAFRFSQEQISQEIAQKFASKCYTQLELYHFKQVFLHLADTQSGLRYWSESSVCRFLELPDSLAAGPVVYQMATFLGAFPFPSQAPSILTIEALLKVVTLLTDRYKKVLKGGDSDWLKLLYSSLAVYDRRASASDVTSDARVASEANASKLDENTGEILTGEPMEDDDDEDDDDDDMIALSALDALDDIEAIGLGEKQNIRHSIIPTDNLLNLLSLLLLISPLESQQSVSMHSDRLHDEGELQSLLQSARSIVNMFNIDRESGITFKNFKAVIPLCLPHLFQGLNPLFEHFLFDRQFDLSKRKPTSGAGQTDPSSPVAEQAKEEIDGRKLDQSIDHGPRGDILGPALLSQMRFFLPSPTLRSRLRPLFSVSEHGFSLQSFESKVFNWKAPTLLLVSGSILQEEDRRSSSANSFLNRMPPQHCPSSIDVEKRKSQQVVYGAYIPVAWKTTTKEALHNNSTLLFQLSPVHDVYHASQVNKAHLTFTMPPYAQHPGIALGSALPTPSEKQLLPGPVSLHLDDALEYGVFTHISAGGGSFLPSVAPSRRKKDWQDRFEIDALEVWGVGGESEEKERKRRADFEEREARMRREGRASVSGGSGLEADKEILKMAGLIGHGESGGSMG